jgi:hypothetical protein
MKKLLVLLFLLPMLSFSQTINISLDYAGLINEPVQGEVTPITALEIGDEFYLDVTIYNSDNSQRKVTFADIWFTFKNDAFDYLGIDNPNPNGNWYTNQWPSVYEFQNSTTATVDDLYGQYYTDHRWNYIGEQSFHAPMVISSQTTGELIGVVARLKFRYKQVPNGFDFNQSAMLRKASVRDNITGYLFTDVKAFPNQTFDNVPTSTKVTASFKVLFPETLDPTLFDGGLYTKDPNDVQSWLQPDYATYENFSTDGSMNITQGFDRTSDLAVIANWDGYVVDAQNGDYTITFGEQYDEIVTISDVALAFAELNNRGINQNEVGNEFGNGIQFMNADVNGDGQFNSDDTYLLLSQVLDVSTYLEGDGMVYASKFYPKAQYDTITTTNYSQIPNGTTLMNYLDNKNNSKLQFSFESAITWRGDVNLSHSTTPNVQSEQTTTAKVFIPSYAKATNKVERQISTTITTELVNGKVIANITLDPKQQKVIGAQYKVKFDSSKLIFDEINYQTNNVSTNFSNLKNDYINIGSFVQIKDQYLDGKTKYTLTFTPKVQLDNTLGLVILTNTDAVNAKSEQLKMNIE